MARWQNVLLVVAPLLPSLILFSQVEGADIRSELVASSALALLGYVATLYVLPTFTPFLVRNGLSGKDMCKKGTAAADKPM